MNLMPTLVAFSHRWFAGRVGSLALAWLLVIPLGLAQTSPPTTTTPQTGTPLFRGPYPETFTQTPPTTIPGRTEPGRSPRQAEPAPSRTRLTPDPAERPLADPQMPVDPALRAPRPADAVPVTVTLTETPEVEEQMLLNQVLKGTVIKSESLPVDLPAVLRLVEEQSLPVTRDQIVARIQKNAFYRSLSEMLPDVIGTYQHSYFKGGIQIFGDQILEIEQTRIIPQVTASWTIFPGGQQVFQALAARRRQRGLESQSGETLQVQLSEAAREYYLLVEAALQIRNIEISIAEARSQVEFNEARFQAGVGTRLDVMRARNLLVQQERSLIDAQNQLARAEQALLNRLNLEPEIHLIPVEVAAQPRMLVPITLSSRQVLAMAQETHPDLLQNQLEIKALRAEAWAVLSRIIPSVRLEAYVNATGPEYGMLQQGRFRGLFLESNLLENLGTAIPLDYRNLHLQIKQKEVERRMLLRDIQTAVVNSYLDTRSFAQAILAAREELEVAEESYRLAVGRYRAGLGINVDVLDAEAALNTARTSLAAVILGFNRSQVELLRSMGVVTTDNLLYGLSLPTATSEEAPAATPTQAPPVVPPQDATPPAAPDPSPDNGMTP